MFFCAHLSWYVKLMSQGQVAASFKALHYICFTQNCTAQKKQDQARRMNNIMAVLDMPAIFDMLKTFCLHVFVQDRSSWMRLAYCWWTKWCTKQIGQHQAYQTGFGINSLNMNNCVWIHLNNFARTSHFINMLQHKTSKSWWISQSPLSPTVDQGTKKQL